MRYFFLLLFFIFLGISFSGCEIKRLNKIADAVILELEYIVNDTKAVRRARVLALKCDFKDECFQDGLDDIVDESCQDPEQHKEESEESCKANVKEILEWLYEEQKAYW